VDGVGVEVDEGNVRFVKDLIVVRFVRLGLPSAG
jgi:hypothetical protein